MSLFYSEKKVFYGGIPFIRIAGTDFNELKGFFDRWDGSFAYADEEVRKRLQSGDLNRREMDALKVHALDLKWSCPARKVGLTRTREPIQILVHTSREPFLKDQEIPELPEGYFPVLNMMLREQFAKSCPGGMTSEMKKFYANEIRGKVIDLVKLKWGKGVVISDDQEIKNLNNMLAKIDLGRRSDLKYYDNAVEQETVGVETPTPVIKPAEVQRSGDDSPHEKVSFAQFKKDQGLL